MSNGRPAAPPEQAGPPAPIPQQVIERGAAALDGIVEPTKRAEAVRAVLGAFQITVTQTAITQKAHSGPLPDPEDMGGYEAIFPGAAQRIMDMAERDQRAVIASHTRAQWHEFAFKVTCVLGGVFALALILWAIVYLGERGQNAAVVALAAVGVSGIVGVIVNAWVGKPSAAEQPPVVPKAESNFPAPPA